MTLDADTAQRALTALHLEVHGRAQALAAQHGERLQCKKGCSSCCVDDLTVFEVEAERIRRAYPQVLAHQAAHPPGGCAFLDSAGACRVYEARPYVCRTQGLPLRWSDEDEPEAEFRDICHLNEPHGPPLVELPEEQCWTLGDYEGQLATLQVRWTGAPQRVGLRELFGR